MKKLLFLFSALLFFSCSSSNDDESGVPSLTIVNNFSKWSVTGVSLQDYTFDNLQIDGGSRRTFVLSDGIPSGSLDIAVIISYNCSGRDMTADNVRVDFYDGKTTTISINSTLDPNDTESQLQDCFEYELIVS